MKAQHLRVLPFLALLVGCSTKEAPSARDRAKAAASTTSVTLTSAPGSADAPNVVDLKPSGGPLKEQIAREHARAGGRTFIVQTTASWCPPCKALKKYMGDPQMKAALANVHLVRVDIDDFSEQLRGAELTNRSVPWFVKLDTDNHPVDALSSGEWGDDVPANMAPILDSFAKGTFTKRKMPWQAGKWL